MNVHTNLWHWDWNVHGAVRAKLIPNIGHTDLWLVDAIIDALHGLDLKCVPFELRAWERTRTDVKPLTTIGVQFAQLGIVAKQLDHLPRTLLRKNIAAQLGTSDDAIDCIVKGDTPRLAKVFGVLTSMKHCEELERRAQETVATNNALKPVLREVEMRVRKESEPTEPGHQPRPTPNRGTPRALPVHIDHNAHLEVNFADAEGGGDCDDGRFASPRSSGAAATASPLGGTNHPRGSTGQGASASAELEPGGAAQDPGECATGRQVRGYVRLNDLNPQEREQHAAEKHAKKVRDRRDRRAAKRQRTAGPQTASSCADDSSEQ